MTTFHQERPGFWLWVAVHAELIPSWSWPVLLVIEAVSILKAQGFH
jgi:hypothetical protein